MKILWLPVLAMFVGCSPETPATPKLTGDPFDPEKSLYPEFPITRVLIVKHEPVRGYFAFGELPQFRVTFSNNSETVVDVSGTPIDGTRFRPYIFLHILREDGRDVGYGTDLIVATNVSRILPGSTFQIDFPGSNIVATRTEFYLHDPDILLPGKYQCYFQFWIDRQGEPERLLSPLNPIVVVDDGSSDAQISKAVQTARGINDHLALVIRGDKDNLISLTAQNNGTEPLYLGHDWTWRSRRAGEQVWNEQGGGLRPGGYITVHPNGTQSLGCVSFRDHKPPGKYTIQVRYFDRDGQLHKESNTITIRVR